MEYKSENHILQIKFKQYVESCERREECHGYHYFTDTRVTNIVESITIDVNGFELDITDKFSEIQLQQISESLD